MEHQHLICVFVLLSSSEHIVFLICRLKNNNPLSANPRKLSTLFKTISCQSNKLAYVEKANKVFNDLPNEIREDICAMSFSMFKNKLKNYLFDKTIAKILSCS